MTDTHDTRPEETDPFSHWAFFNGIRVKLASIVRRARVRRVRVRRARERLDRLDRSRARRRVPRARAMGAIHPVAR